MGSLPMPGRASSHLSKLHCQNEDTTTSGPLLRWLLNRVRGGDRVGASYPSIGSCGSSWDPRTNRTRVLGSPLGRVMG